MQTPKLTPVQRRVVTALAAEPGGRARVGRGLPFKCNRITARALRDLGLVETDAGYATGPEEVPFDLELTRRGWRASGATPVPTPTAQAVWGTRAKVRAGFLDIDPGDEPALAKAVEELTTVEHVWTVLARALSSAQFDDVRGAAKRDPDPDVSESARELADWWHEAESRPERLDQLVADARRGFPRDLAAPAAAPPATAPAGTP